MPNLQGPNLSGFSDLAVDMDLLKGKLQTLLPRRAHVHMSAFAPGPLTLSLALRLRTR